MPRLREFLDLIRVECARGGYPISDNAWCQVAHAVRVEFGGQRVYVPPPNSRKDPDRRDAVRQAAKRLPTGVAAEVAGVSVSYAYRITKGKT